MPRNATMGLELPGRETTELLTGLAAIAAGFLWFWVYMLTTGAPELCSVPPQAFAHCPACYPAALCTLAALAGGARLLTQGALAGR